MVTLGLGRLQGGHGSAAPSPQGGGESACHRDLTQRETSLQQLPARICKPPPVCTAHLHRDMAAALVR